MHVSKSETGIFPPSLSRRSLRWNGMSKWGHSRQDRELSRTQAHVSISEPRGRCTLAGSVPRRKGTKSVAKAYLCAKCNLMKAGSGLWMDLGKDNGEGVACYPPQCPSHCERRELRLESLMALFICRLCGIVRCIFRPRWRVTCLQDPFLFIFLHSRTCGQDKTQPTSAKTQKCLVDLAALKCHLSMLILLKQFFQASSRSTKQCLELLRKFMFFV